MKIHKGLAALFACRVGQGGLMRCCLEEVWKWNRP